jgi:two-component system OmpR family response regulator
VIHAGGALGLAAAGGGGFDMHLVDRMPPTLDGLSLVEALRRQGDQTPVLSALGGIEDKVVGLKAGADVYLVKPDAFAELIARVEALARRRDTGSVQITLRVGDLEMDMIGRAVRREGKQIDLQPREFQLREFLMRHAGQSVTRTILLEKVWEYHFDPHTNVIDVHVSRLSAKLDKELDRPMLLTVRGVGYRLEAEGRAMRLPALFLTMPFRLTLLFLALFAAAASAFLAYVYVVTAGLVSRLADASITRDVAALERTDSRAGR